MTAPLTSSESTAPGASVGRASGAPKFEVLATSKRVGSRTMPGAEAAARAGLSCSGLPGWNVPTGVTAPAPGMPRATTLTTDAANSSDPNVVTRVGLLFNWVPSRIAYVSDPLNDRVVALDLGDDGTLFTAGAPRFITSRSFHRPIDLAPAVPEIASHNFSSNTTLGGGSDLYVLCRGNGTIVRVTQAGQVVAVRRVVAQGMPPFAVSGISVSEDARSIWVTAVDRGGEGF